MFSRKIWFLSKKTCLYHLQCNWVTYLTLIGALTAHDYPLALICLKSLTLRAANEAFQLVAFLKERNRKKLKKLKSKKTI